MHSNLISAAIVITMTSIAHAQHADAPATLAGLTFLTSPGEAWTLGWHDEFTDDALDQTKWRIGLPWGGSDGEGRHHNDQYASYIMDHNVVVGNGQLQLLTRREDVVDKKGRTFNFTEGLITTAHAFRHRYGYWEARIKLPTEAGPGLWPAFWTLADGWPPEMDICEIWTGSSKSHQGLCYRPAEGGREKWDDENVYAPLPTGWTTYGMEWGPGYQLYNINGRVTKRVFGDHVTQDKHYILLNSGVESAQKPTAATVFPNAFSVDYVRVYARPEVAVVHNGGFEDVDQQPWTKYGHAVRVGYGAHAGHCAMRVDAGPSAAEQKIYGLTPGTIYVLSAWVRMLTTGGEANLGVKNHGGEEVSVAATDATYRQVNVTFTTGPEATTALIYCYLREGAGAALLDDVELREAAE